MDGPSETFAAILLEAAKRAKSQVTVHQSSGSSISGTVSSLKGGWVRITQSSSGSKGLMSSGKPQEESDWIKVSDITRIRLKGDVELHGLEEAA